MRAIFIGLLLVFYNAYAGQTIYRFNNKGEFVYKKVYKDDGSIVISFPAPKEVLPKLEKPPVWYDADKHTKQIEQKQWSM